MSEPTKTNSLAEALQDEIKRVYGVKALYDGLPGGVGFIGASLIQLDLDYALKALAESDVIACMQAYEKLKEVES